MDTFAKSLDTSHGGHIGKIIMENLKKNEDDLHQIDVGRGIEETHGSVLKRSIDVARAMKSKNLKLGDIVMICAMNHNDAAIPFIASMFIGTVPVNLAVGMTYEEVKHGISVAHPKIVFSDPSMVDVIDKVLIDMKIDVDIILFDNDLSCKKYMTFKEFSKPADTAEDFVCDDFDPKETTAFAVCSSGTTGLPKLVAISHRSAAFMIIVPTLSWKMQGGTMSNWKRCLSFSPMYWVSGIYSVLGACMNGNIRLQSSESFTVELAIDAIEKYKVDVFMISPMGMYEMTKYPNIEARDFSSLKIAFCGGSALNIEVVNEIQQILKCVAVVGYGSTEGGTICSSIGYRNGSIGKLGPWVEWKIVDPETEEVLGPNKTGEFRLKSIMMFQKYYNDPESTAKAFDSENFYKTGDLLYYDEEENFYFVDRMKEMIKYRNFQIATAELENKICTLPEVLNAAVVGVPDLANGELPMAFVQLVEGKTVSVQKIKDVIKDSLSDSKQLRGGVVILDKLPTTYSGKVNRKELNILKHTVKGE